MIEKEISELRRRFRADRTNIDAVCGCYVNERKEIVSEFTQSLGLLAEEETQKILTLLKKSLSGTLGKNLVDLTFPTQAVLTGEEHRLLTSLRDTGLKDAKKLHAFYTAVADSTELGSGYLILLGCDAYDVPYVTRMEEQFDEASSEAYRYVVCSICPVKQSRPALSFQVQENCISSIGADWMIAPPEMGFVFPAFDDRATNLYAALYYTKSAADSHADFVQAVFNTPLPMPAEEQKATFHAILSESAGENCSYQVVQAVQEQLTGLIEEHKEQKIREPLRVSCSTLNGILSYAGVDDAQRADFSRRYEESFGEEATLPPRNLIDPKHMTVATPDVTIQVNPQRSGLIETRTIDGIPYILIRAQEGVEVNGVQVHIP